MNTQTASLFYKRSSRLALLVAGCTTALSAAQTLPHPIVLGAPAHVIGTGADMRADFSTPIPSEQTMHLLVGHSSFVNTKHRLSRVYVTNPGVLDSYTASPNQIVITAKAPGMSTLIVWDEMGDSQVFTVSADGDLSNLRAALAQAMPNEKFDVQEAEGRITLAGFVGTKDTADNAMKIATVYAKDVHNALIVNSSKVKQVRLKVRFVEIDRSKSVQFGFNIFGLAGNTLFSTTTSQFPTGPTLSSLGSGSSTSSSSTGSSSTGQTLLSGTSIQVSDPLNFLIYSASANIGIGLKDLESKQLLQVLAEPTMMTMSGQKASFLAGGEFPFPVIQPGGTNGAASVSISFRPYGVKLEFTPVVNPDGTIDLTVAPEVSALDYTNSVSISGYTIPALSTRKAQTEVVLRDGQTFAISGLIDQRTTDAYQRTPGITSVPIIGALFKSKSLNHGRTELLVVVTPEIIDPLSAKDTLHVPDQVVPVLYNKSFDEYMQKKVDHDMNKNSEK